MTLIDSGTGIAPGRTTIAGAAAAPWTVSREGDVTFLLAPDTPAPEPADWRDRLRSTLATDRSIALVGGLRLDGEGRVCSAGEMVVHPLGCHGHLAGILAGEQRYPVEVDTVAAGVVAMRTEVLEDCLGEAPLAGPLAGLTLGLLARLRGHRCVVVPDVRVTDERPIASTDADDAAFAERFGFSWRAADLDVVRRRHAGTGLLWNVRLHGRDLPFEKYDARPAMHWTAYAGHAPYERRADHLVGMAADAHGADRGRPVLDLGCGDGLFSHLLALRGLPVIGVDREAVAIEQARARTRGQAYPGRPPSFVEGCGGDLPVEPGTVGTVIMLDVIEHLPNPVAVLRSVERALAPGGRLLVSTPEWQFNRWSDPVYHIAEYTMRALVDQIEAATALRVARAGRITGVYRDLVVLAERPAASA